MRKVKVHPSKIERLQHAGLAPRALHHRHPTLTGPDLWPEGALAQYVAAVPLIRRRHSARELAALTLLGWGYSVEIDFLRHSYARAYALDDDTDDRIDALLDHYKNRGMPVLRTAMSHVRTHGLANGSESAEELAEDLIASVLGLASGNAGSDQLRMLLIANLPISSEAPEAFVDWALNLFTIVQRDIALPRLLETVNKSSTEDLLQVQPEVSVGMEQDLENLGGIDAACSGCRETLGLMVALAIPIQLRLEGRLSGLVDKVPMPKH